jgi:diguanylate cyclase (GGDEF)-like protein
MILLQAWTFSFSASILLAAMAIVGYLIGRRRARLKNRFDSRSEISRALEVAEELESIAGRLRNALTAHRPAIARFHRRLNRFESASGVSWPELCDRADELLKPTLRLGTEVSHAYAEILRQMTRLASFAELRSDPLTGINNRRAFDESLDSALVEQARFPAPLTLAILDVDRFKQVNDQHGHLRGDRVLQDLAQVLKSNVRECDVLARFGGEEFVVLMPRTELHAACNLAERLRAKVAAEMPLTVSLGLASWLPADTAIAFVARADAALYAAKESGRNCVHLHEGVSGRTVGTRTTAEKKPDLSAIPSEPASELPATAEPAAARIHDDACMAPGAL